jgi:hypothetical protein
MWKFKIPRGDDISWSILAEPSLGYDWTKWALRTLRDDVKANIGCIDDSEGSMCHNNVG